MLSALARSQNVRVLAKNRREFLNPRSKTTDARRSRIPICGLIMPKSAGETARHRPDGFFYLLTRSYITMLNFLGGVVGKIKSRRISATIGGTGEAQEH